MLENYNIQDRYQESHFNLKIIANGESYRYANQITVQQSYYARTNANNQFLTYSRNALAYITRQINVDFFFFSISQLTKLVISIYIEIKLLIGK